MMTGDFFVDLSLDYYQYCGVDEFLFNGRSLRNIEAQRAVAYINIEPGHNLPFHR
jgi:hypothetical protein